MEKDKIEVGEYIRTKTGNIFKVIGGNSDNYDIDINYFKLEITEDEWFESNRYNDNGYFFNERNILKHSKNIIDLIEVGDYVNEQRVFETKYRIIDGEKVILVENYSEWTDDAVVLNKDIRSIVTKEQFKEMEYRV